MQLENKSAVATPLRAPRIAFVGVGGMGVNTVGALDATVSRFARRVVVDSDHATLRASPVSHTLQIGTALTGGQSTGGLMDIGRRCANTDFLKIRDSLLNTDVAVLLVGLGGGLGSGAAPMIAQTARDEGIMVISVVALPFAFEGAARAQQADTALVALRAHSDAVITVPNDHLLVEDETEAPLEEAFKKGAEQLGQGFRALWQLLGQRTLINLDFSHLKQALTANGGVSTMIFAEGGGSGKVKLVMNRIQTHPAVARDNALAQAPGLLLGVLGGEDLTVMDVQEVVLDIVGQLPEGAAHVLGVGIDPALRNRITVVALAGQEAADVDTAADAGMAAAAGETTSTAPPKAERIPRKLVTAKPAPTTRKVEQEELPLSAVSKGRFRDVEPTLYQGEDLDLPTFIRRGQRLSN